MGRTVTLKSYRLRKKEVSLFGFNFDCICFRIVVLPACLAPTKIKMSLVSKYLSAFIVMSLIMLINTKYPIFCIWHAP